MYQVLGWYFGIALVDGNRLLVIFICGEDDCHWGQKKKYTKMKPSFLLSSRQGGFHWATDAVQRIS